MNANLRMHGKQACVYLGDILFEKALMEKLEAFKEKIRKMLRRKSFDGKLRCMQMSPDDVSFGKTSSIISML